MEELTKAEIVKQTRELLQEYANAENALDQQDIRNQIILLNRPLADAVAESFREWFSPHEFRIVPHVAALGLVRAVEKFDLSMEYEFSTYATYWVRANIKRELAREKQTIRWPERLVQIRECLDTVVDCFYCKYGRSHRDELELAEFVGCSVKLLQKVVECVYLPQCYSGEESEFPEANKEDSILERAAAGETYCPVHTVENCRLSKELREIINALPYLDKQALLLHYAHGYTFTEIGERFGISRQNMTKRCKRVMKVVREQAGVVVAEPQPESLFAATVPEPTRLSNKEMNTFREFAQRLEKTYLKYPK